MSDKLDNVLLAMTKIIDYSLIVIMCSSALFLVLLYCVVLRNFGIPDQLNQNICKKFGYECAVYYNGNIVCVKDAIKVDELLK